MNPHTFRKNDIESILEKYNALLKGHFLLSSGLHSDIYIQCAALSQYPKITEFLMKKLKEKFLRNKKIDIIISPAVGGIIFGYELSRQTGSRNIFCERENGVLTLRRNFSLNKDEKVVILEDVITTGKTIKEILKIVKKHKAKPILICSIVNRGGLKSILGTPIKSLFNIKIKNYKPQECLLCKKNIPFVKPGSRITY